jgi:hypothetical protein
MAVPRKPTKLYRLRYLNGKSISHSVPNPDAEPAFAGDPEAAHTLAHSGDLVPLNEDQYKAFKDKFDPAESGASDVAAADAAELIAAKTLAQQTGQTVNPNVPQPPRPQPPQQKPGVPPQFQNPAG